MNEAKACTVTNLFPAIGDQWLAMVRCRLRGEGAMEILDMIIRHISDPGAGGCGLVCWVWPVPGRHASGVGQFCRILGVGFHFRQVVSI